MHLNAPWIEEESDRNEEDSDYLKSLRRETLKTEQEISEEQINEDFEELENMREVF